MGEVINFYSECDYLPLVGCELCGGIEFYVVVNIEDSTVSGIACVSCYETVEDYEPIEI